jgi:NAD-dependent dihydropyrimidine dehydrogenase PreA subunit
MTVTRKIVHIDEEKCDGCGLCVPSCAEGALQIINGKARLMADNLCDGLGACLGHCPQDAIWIEERAAVEFDEQAVESHLKKMVQAAHPHPAPPKHEPPVRKPAPPLVVEQHAGGCPGSRMRMLQPKTVPLTKNGGEARPSRLGQWPVQLALVPPTGKIWQNADVLIAADCIPFAYPDFHDKLLAGRTLAIACPKLDDMQPYVQKLAMIFASNPIRSITVARMEVPCCGGILRAVQMALAHAGREDLPVEDVVIGIDGMRRN